MSSMAAFGLGVVAALLAVAIFLLMRQPNRSETDHE